MLIKNIIKIIMCFSLLTGSAKRVLLITILIEPYTNLEIIKVLQLSL